MPDTRAPPSRAWERTRKPRRRSPRWSNNSQPLARRSCRSRPGRQRDRFSGPRGRPTCPVDNSAVKQHQHGTTATWSACRGGLPSLETCSTIGRQRPFPTGAPPRRPLQTEAFQHPGTGRSAPLHDLEDLLLASAGACRGLANAAPFWTRSCNPIQVCKAERSEPGNPRAPERLRRHAAVFLSLEIPISARPSATTVPKMEHNKFPF